MQLDKSLLLVQDSAEPDRTLALTANCIKETGAESERFPNFPDRLRL